MMVAAPDADRTLFIWRKTSQSRGRIHHDHRGFVFAIWRTPVALLYVFLHTARIHVVLVDFRRGQSTDIRPGVMRFLRSGAAKAKMFGRRLGNLFTNAVATQSPAITINIANFGASPFPSWLRLAHAPSCRQYVVRTDIFKFGAGVSITFLRGV